MDKNIKSIIIYVIAIVLVITVFIGFKVYREQILSGTIKDTLQKYFENNNTHIASRNFSIGDINIKCRGNNAYLVEFSLLFDDNTSNGFNKLGATIYKNNDIWNVKGFGTGLTTDELRAYNFKCYN